MKSSGGKSGSGSRETALVKECESVMSRLSEGLTYQRLGTRIEFFGIR